MKEPSGTPNSGPRITLFLAGDVMTGRGIDQVMAQPSEPRLYEPFVRDATQYVALAEKANGPIPKPVSPAYIWGEAIEELDRVSPDARIVNLETSITTSDDYWPNKGINYRMHPDNTACLSAARIDCCVLANNHVLDWGYGGLEETLAALGRAGLRTAGAGRTRREAQAPAVIPVAEKGRVLVFAWGSVTSGIPGDWGATENQPGVNLLTDLSDGTVRQIGSDIKAQKGPNDIVVASIHWGSNWGYAIPAQQTEFAYQLIEDGGVDIVHGHSSHHPRGIEVHAGKPIIYGCGDLVNDYEGIGGYEQFRADLSLMYFITMDVASGELVRFVMTPTRIRRFRLERAVHEEAVWLTSVLNREGLTLGTRASLSGDDTITLQWAEES